MCPRRAQARALQAPRNKERGRRSSDREQEADLHYAGSPRIDNRMEVADFGRGPEALTTAEDENVSEARDLGRRRRILAGRRQQLRKNRPESSIIRTGTSLAGFTTSRVTTLSTTTDISRWSKVRMKLEAHFTRMAHVGTVLRAAAERDRESGIGALASGGCGQYQGFSERQMRADRGFSGQQQSAAAASGGATTTGFGDAS
ncbi:hypothetical protein KSP39_PZI020189 [Platanthera zijinensis]|uniref:Uncharacterized protein n=1 Tax=Platanthera zijinensis TaxID=2320716 RepID=A0AAP0FWR8_9ASPA